MKLRDFLLPALCVASLMPAMAAAQTISTVAGNGGNGNTGDGGQATSAQVSQPTAIAPIPGGGYYIASPFLIRKVDIDGIISTVAGNGSAGNSGDGGPAADAKLGFYIHSLKLAPDGSLYLTDSSNHRIRKIGVDGIIVTVAGTGTGWYSGDGGPAVDASIRNPAGLELDANGHLYISDSFNCRVRKVDGSGLISTVIGTGTCTSTGDGGSALSATLSYPWHLRFDSVGNLFVVDQGGHKVRRVTTDGNFSTFAGTGTDGYSGDGGLAIDANLSIPTGLDFDAAGNLYVTVYGSHRIRKITPGGRITSPIGNGTYAFSGDGGPAAAAAIGGVMGIAITDGRMYLAQRDFHRVRVVEVDETPEPDTTCAISGYTGTKLTWCQNICEKGYTGATLDMWIHRWVNRYRDLPYCGLGEEEGPPQEG